MEVVQDKLKKSFNLLFFYKFIYIFYKLIFILNLFIHFIYVNYKLNYLYKFSINLFLLDVALCAVSLVAASRGYSLVAMHGLLIAVASLVVEHGL